MTELTATTRSAGRSPLEIVVDRVWRFFCSVRAAVYEIAILGVLVLIGTLRGSDVPRWIANGLPITEGIVDRWYAWDVFHSLPFIFLLTLISVAIAICTMNRAPGIWNSIAHPTITTTHGFIRNADISASYAVSGTVDEARDAITKALQTRRYRVLSEPHNGEIHVYADRYRYAKLGTFPFHLALILILVGGIVGARYGFRENEFIVPEGSTRAVGHGTGLSIELVKFTDTYFENGGAEEYRSDIVVYENGKEVDRGPITVNHPMVVGSTTIYQSSFGQAVQVRLNDSAGNVIWDDSIETGLWFLKGEPNLVGIQQLPMLDSTLIVVLPSSNPMVQPTQDKYKLLSGEVYIELRPNCPENLSQIPATDPDGARLLQRCEMATTGSWPQAKFVQGKPLTLDGYTIEFVRERQYSLMQVASNPGMPIFWAASFLLVGGLGVVFYFPHRRIRAIVANRRDGEGVTIDVAPLAKRDWSAKREFGLAVGSLTGILGSEPTVRRKDGDDDVFAGMPAS